jgi:hypothetical protein
MNLALALLCAAAACPVATPAAGQPGLTAVGKVPAEAAMRLNGEGKRLYRQERWSEAREKYRAALAADPELLGATLNVACSYSRQRRYGEAADEAARLIRRGFVPWNREVSEAADLGILQDHAAAFAKIQTARRAAAAAWGQQVSKGVLFVARTKPPVKVTGEGVLVLGLNQEIFAWIPETGRFFQVTAEDGRVLAFAVSADARRIAYLLAGKLVRPAGQVGVLRGLALRVLELPTMTLGARAPVAGDVRRAELAFGALPELKVTDAAGAGTTWRLTPVGLEASPGLSASAQAEPTVLTGLGVMEPNPRKIKREHCSFSLAVQTAPAGLQRLQVTPATGRPFPLATRFGAGLHGLPFPGDAPVGSPPPPRRPKK